MGASVNTFGLDNRKNVGHSSIKKVLQKLGWFPKPKDNDKTKSKGDSKPEKSKEEKEIDQALQQRDSAAMDFGKFHRKKKSYKKQGKVAPSDLKIKAAASKAHKKLTNNKFYTLNRQNRDGKKESKSV